MQRVALSIPSQVRFERVVRASAGEIGQACGFEPERIADLQLAVSEAVTNAIEHGNGARADLLVEVVFVLDAKALEIRIADQGNGTSAVDWQRRVVEEHNLDNDMVRGFGMHLIQALVDDCEIESSANGTVLTLRLYRKEKTP